MIESASPNGAAARLPVAIYARYSSDNQRDASITDQMRVCRAFAERQGWTIAQEYSDHAVSGAIRMRASPVRSPTCQGGRPR